MAWCEREGMDYIFGLAQNARLKKQIEPEMAQAEKQFEQTKTSARVFTEFLYATQDTWSRQRRPLGIIHVTDVYVVFRLRRHKLWLSRAPGYLGTRDEKSGLAKPR